MKFTEAKQEAFLALLEGGNLRAESARRCDVSTALVRQALKMGLDSNGQPLPGTFAERVAEIEEVEREAVESKLYLAAVAGEPWAVQMWLKGKYREDWADKPGPLVQVNQNTLNIDGSPDERRRVIESLQSELNARLAISPAITSTAQEVLEADEVQ